MPVENQPESESIETWFRDLLEAGALARGSRQPDLASVVEDVRSVDYNSVLEGTEDTSPDQRPSFELFTVCGDQSRVGDDNIVAFYYAFSDPSSDTPSDVELGLGAFRRGSDGQWRWLITSLAVPAAADQDCVDAAAEQTK